MTHQWQRGNYVVSTDQSRLDLDVIHDYLGKSSYWATGRSLETVRRSIENSLSFGLYEGEKQIGFARVITDYATFAWLADVFVLDSFRGQGLGKWLVELSSRTPNFSSFADGCLPPGMLTNSTGNSASPN
ncbi:MAG TPA: GNAT family N-acetyltransferase [Pyrinomonadaceae bacterium]|jgi:GNAT superfamily N-acetyltransferase|nr:GNAT family N-acetyltransferase [Pyrinomonadaceae bacterium]